MWNFKFIIDRSKWRSGSDGQYSIGLGPTALLNREGYMCCLGQVCQQLEVSNEDLLDKATPESLVDYPIIKKTLLVDETGINTDICYDLMEVNDSIDYDQYHREKKIVELFQDINIEIEFINEPLPNKNRHE